jgi:hypothetical protein
MVRLRIRVTRVSPISSRFFFNLYNLRKQLIREPAPACVFEVLKPTVGVVFQFPARHAVRLRDCSLTPSLALVLMTYSLLSMARPLHVHPSVLPKFPLQTGNSA